MNKTKTKMHFFLLWSVCFQRFFKKRTMVATYQMCSVNMEICYRDANSIHESNQDRKSSTNMQSMCSAKFDAHNFIVSQFCLFDLNFQRAKFIVLVEFELIKDCSVSRSGFRFFGKWLEFRSKILQVLRLSGTAKIFLDRLQSVFTG